MNDTKPSRKRRFLLFGCGGCLALLLALVAVPFAVGSQLEEEYHGHVVARFDRPPAEVFDALLDHRTTPVTGPQHEGTTDLPSEEGRAAWVEDMGESAITVRTIEQTEDARIVRTYEDSVVPMTARVELVLRPPKQAHLEALPTEGHAPAFADPFGCRTGH